MNRLSAQTTTGLLFSGGLDSAILLGRLVTRGARVQPFYVDSGLVWQADELRFGRKFLQAVARPELQPLVVLDLPLRDLYAGHWSLTGDETPGESSPDEAVYLPGRNALLAIKAILWCQLHGIRKLALAVLGSSPFADATPEFFAAFAAALDRACGVRVEILAPFSGLVKREVMDLGRRLPLQFTFSCIAPQDGLHCGRCNKCAERRKAFTTAGTGDPTRYAATTPLLL